MSRSKLGPNCGRGLFLLIGVLMAILLSASALAGLLGGSPERPFTMSKGFSEGAINNALDAALDQYGYTPAQKQRFRDEVDIVNVWTSKGFRARTLAWSYDTPACTPPGNGQKNLIEINIGELIRYANPCGPVSAPGDPLTGTEQVLKVFLLHEIIHLTPGTTTGDGPNVPNGPGPPGGARGPNGGGLPGGLYCEHFGRRYEDLLNTCNAATTAAGDGDADAVKDLCALFESLADFLQPPGPNASPEKKLEYQSLQWCRNPANFPAAPGHPTYGLPSSLSSTCAACQGI